MVRILLTLNSRLTRGGSFLLSLDSSAAPLSESSMSKVRFRLSSYVIVMYLGRERTEHRRKRQQLLCEYGLPCSLAEFLILTQQRQEVFSCIDRRQCVGSPSSQ